jgi:hypothetical protein
MGGNPFVSFVWFVVQDQGLAPRHGAGDLPRPYRFGRFSMRTSGRASAGSKPNTWP